MSFISGSCQKVELKKANIVDSTLIFSVVTSRPIKNDSKNIVLFSPVDSAKRLLGIYYNFD